MALSDTISELTGKSPATKNRVDLLLDKLKVDAPEDYKTLTFALRDKNLRPVVLTKAIRKEYGIATVTDHSISDWRSKNIAELTGL